MLVGFFFPPNLDVSFVLLERDKAILYSPVDFFFLPNLKNIIDNNNKQKQQTYSTSTYFPYLENTKGIFMQIQTRVASMTIAYQ